MLASGLFYAYENAANAAFIEETRSVFERYASHKFIALCLQGCEPFYVRRLKPTHGLKSFSWTCCGLILSFGFTTLTLLSCGIGISDASAGAVTSDVAISFLCWFCIISTTS